MYGMKMKKGKLHASVHYENKCHRSDGQMVDYVKNGKGILNHEEANSYIGDFVDGKFHGFGMLYNKNSIMYEGQFSNGKFHGKGIKHL